MALTFKREAWKGFLFLCLTLSGCASFDPNDYKQTVRVTSDPPGALIFERGQQIGVAPAFVRVRRRKRPEITLQYPGNDERIVPLKRHYRWGDSFAMNLVFGTLAPIGWAVDFATGVAWKMDDPPLERFSGKPIVQKKPDVIAIAPPVALDTETSDVIGNLLEKNVGAMQRGSVLSYRETAPYFEYYSSDHGLTSNPKLRYNLYYQLKANKIFVSKADVSSEGYLVTGHFHDPYTGDDSSPRTWILTSDDGSLNQQVSEHHFYTEYFHLFPNTIFLNLANYEPSIGIDDQEYKGSSTRGENVWDKMLDLISFIGLDHLERPRENVKGQFTFDFVPVVNASQVKLSFDSYKPLQAVKFDRTYIDAGYGIEVGHLSRVGFFYLDVVPALTFTRIHARIPDNDQRLSRLSIQPVSELGYTRFLSDHFVARLFVRTISEDSRLWENAIRRATHGNEIAGNVISGYAGIGIGYYIPSVLNRKGNWQAVERR